MSQHAAGRRGRKMGAIGRAQLKWGYVFIGPAIVGLLLFSFGPMLFSFAISFTHWDVVTPMRFAGLENYRTLIGDPLVWKSLRVTAWYTLLSVPLITVVTFLVAMLLNTRVRGMSVFRAIFYLPSIVPAVASAAVWMYIYNPMFGLLNSILKAFGLPGQNFIFSRGGVIPSLAVMAVWAAGNTVIIYLAGLQGVSRQLYEAAEIDGAGFSKKFVYITVPMMSPIIFYNVVMGIINSMQTFTQAYIMTDGGPDNESLFYSLLLYRTAFKNQRMGYSAAMSWVLFLIIALLTVAVFKSGDRWVHYENGGE